MKEIRERFNYANPTQYNQSQNLRRAWSFSEIIDGRITVSHTAFYLMSNAKTTND